MVVLANPFRRWASWSIVPNATSRGIDQASLRSNLAGVIDGLVFNVGKTLDALIHVLFAVRMLFSHAVRITKSYRFL